MNAFYLVLLPLALTPAIVGIAYGLWFWREECKKDREWKQRKRGKP